MGLGETDRAFQYLEEAIAERDTIFVLLKEIPSAKILLDDPRFPVLLKKIGLDE